MLNPKTTFKCMCFVKTNTPDFTGGSSLKQSCQPVQLIPSLTLNIPMGGISESGLSAEGATEPRCGPTAALGAQ